MFSKFLFFNKINSFFKLIKERLFFLLIFNKNNKNNKNWKQELKSSFLLISEFFNNNFSRLEKILFLFLIFLIYFICLSYLSL